ncbi:alpha/beta hydrolase [Massilia sp. PAMC28688]|uniref:RBBP9/YdeN family alpha/beta hydrolase n=1 Tax=Massilia sp. PAMC28688 TaxID=2861283 RepID=UPI001C62DB53|nr:alpha/beta hydrolase [Massilia sp. PAMC28688]QYF92475.1 alpha/beta hydrolase [Massilia sp. PAMC28688]
MECNVLTVPGLWNSGPQHWQSLWEQRHPEWVRVAHRDWNNPERAEWVAELDAAIARCEGPPLLVAHSLGCITVAHWASSGSQLQVAGAFLVAPADVAAASYPVDKNGFTPIPMERLPFPTHVVASADDPFVDAARARQFADAWGSAFTDIGRQGHVNGDSGLGQWDQGYQLLEAFCRHLGHGPGRD